MLEILLVAGGGAEPEARLRVTANDAVIGRSRSADLVLRDPGVSRRHLRVRVVDGAVQIDAEPDASPFVFRAQPTTSARVAVGEHVILGSTVLSVIAGDPGAPAVHSLAQTASDGLDADVRGLSAVTALLHQLAGATEHGRIAAAADTWARVTLGARSAVITDPAVRSGVAGEARPCELVVPMAGQHGDLVLTFAHAEQAAAGSARATAGVAGVVIAASLTAAAAAEELRAEATALRTLAVGSARGFLGSSPAALAVAAMIRKLAGSDATALLLGESGTGKTFAARLIHEHSARAAAPLRVLNCAAIPEALLEAELFGSERGAYSGAHATRVGAFEAAGAGTLLLDEVGELTLASQAKLLRAIEERRFERVGSNTSLELRARILAATNRDLRAMIAAGTFRSDLYFRISVVTMTVPPLRERGTDIGLLADRILADLRTTLARRVHAFTPAAAAALQRYAWPGNVRELRNAVEHACVLGEQPLIEVGDLPELVRAASGPPSPPASGPEGMVVRLPADLRWLEARAIEAALASTGGNRTRAAAILGINRVTLQKKLAVKNG